MLFPTSSGEPQYSRYLSDGHHLPYSRPQLSSKAGADVTVGMKALSWVEDLADGQDGLDRIEGHST